MFVGKLRLGHLAGFDRFDADEHPFDLAAWEADPHALKIGTELAFGDAGDVRSDPAALFRLAFAVDDVPFNRAFSCDLTNSGHSSGNFR